MISQGKRFMKQRVKRNSQVLCKPKALPEFRLEREPRNPESQSPAIIASFCKLISAFSQKGEGNEGRVSHAGTWILVITAQYLVQ